MQQFEFHHTYLKRDMLFLCYISTKHTDDISYPEHNTKKTGKVDGDPVFITGSLMVLNRSEWYLCSEINNI